MDESAVGHFSVNVFFKEEVRRLAQEVTELLVPSGSERLPPQDCTTAAAWSATSSAKRLGASYTPLYTGSLVEEVAPCYASVPLHPVFASHASWHQPEAFVVTVPKGRIWGRRGAVITPDAYILTDVSREFGAYKGISDSRHSIFKQILLPSVSALDGTIAVIAAAGSRNYHHWLFDIIPRLHLIRMSGFSERLDGLIVDYEGLPFQRDAFDALGVDPSKLVLPGEQWNTHFSADLLVVPSLPSNLCTVSNWVVPFLRETFLPPDVGPKKRRLYISRRKAPSRRESNFEEIADFLSKRGFDEYFAEDHTISQTAADFASAEWVIGMHGSGLSNLVFASPGAKVIEFLPRQHLDPYFWMLSNRCGCKYSHLYAEGEPGDLGRDLVADKFDPDVQISVSQLSMVMRLMDDQS